MPQLCANATAAAAVLASLDAFWEEGSAAMQATCSVPSSTARFGQATDSCFKRGAIACNDMKLFQDLAGSNALSGQL